MSSPVRLASFCRLCLTKTKDRVPIFANGDMLDNLLHLIEIQIDPEDEPDAVVCYDCVVTLEGFHQFKEQCHVNDEFVRTVPPKLDCSASSADFGEGEDEEPEEDEDQDQDEGALAENELEEDDHLELSEAEEVFQEKPRRKAAAKKTKKKKVVKSPKKSPVRKAVAKPVSKPQANKKAMKHELSPPEGTGKLDELQVLADSYPDYFYFEKGARSIYYTIVFYGERYNSALFTERYTYWQCTHRRKFHCPAQVVARNDYQSFERRYEHTHRQGPEKEGQAFTPHEALPEIFQICKRIVLQKRTKHTKQNASFADKFQTFATDAKQEIDGDVSGELDNSINESKASLKAMDSDEKVEVDSQSRTKRKIKPNSRYANAASQPKKRTVQPETKPNKKQPTVKSEPKKVQAGEKPKSRLAEKRKLESEESDASENDTMEQEEEEEEELDLAKLEEECEALNVPKKPPFGPSLDEQLVLADSYPDFFFFEKGPRSVYFTLVYYGERFHGAKFTKNYTYWPCIHRRKYKCPAQVVVTSDYQTFERRHHHTHPELPGKEGEAFTPKEALPKVFEICRKMVLRKRALFRKKQIHKYRFLKSLETSKSEEPTSNTEGKVEAIDAEEHDEEAYATSIEDDVIMSDIEYVEEELVETTEG